MVGSGASSKGEGEGRGRGRGGGGGGGGEGEGEGRGRGRQWDNRFSLQVSKSSKAVPCGVRLLGTQGKPAVSCADDLNNK